MSSRDELTPTPPTGSRRSSVRSVLRFAVEGAGSSIASGPEMDAVALRPTASEDPTPPIEDHGGTVRVALDSRAVAALRDWEARDRRGVPRADAVWFLRDCGADLARCRGTAAAILRRSTSPFLSEAEAKKLAAACVGPPPRVPVPPTTPPPRVGAARRSPEPQPQPPSPSATSTASTEAALGMPCFAYAPKVPADAPQSPLQSSASRDPSVVPEQCAHPAAAVDRSPSAPPSTARSSQPRDDTPSASTAPPTATAIRQGPRFALRCILFPALRGGGAAPLPTVDHSDREGEDKGEGKEEERASDVGLDLDVERLQAVALIQRCGRGGKARYGLGEQATQTSETDAALGDFLGRMGLMTL